MTDDQEWTELVEKYYEPIYRFCYQMCKSAAEAEDATQQTFLKAFQKKHLLLDQAKERGWIYQIARNTCIDRLRKAKRFVASFLEHHEPSYTPSLSPIGRKLKEKIDSLPRKQKEAFILRHLHDFSTAETADFLGISAGTVKAHLKRAVDKLREELGDESTETEGEPSSLAGSELR